LSFRTGSYRETLELPYNLFHKIFDVYPFGTSTIYVTSLIETLKKYGDGKHQRLARNLEEEIQSYAKWINDNKAALVDFEFKIEQAMYFIILKSGESLMDDSENIEELSKELDENMDNLVYTEGIYKEMYERLKEREFESNNSPMCKAA